MATVQNIPNVVYRLTSKDLFEILDEYIELDPEHSSRILTSLQHYEDKTLERKVSKYKGQYKRSKQRRSIPPPFTSKRTIEFFIIVKTGEYVHIPIIIKKSTIKNAGFGAFAGSTIPKGARAEYEGAFKNEESANMYYSWEIKIYNKITGKPNHEGKTLMYKDASDISQSNWTRFVNCNLNDDKNNLTMTQRFDKIYYRTRRKIKKGEELFVNYGDEYISYNIKKNG